MGLGGVSLARVIATTQHRVSLTRVIATTQRLFHCSRPIAAEHAPLTSLATSAVNLVPILLALYTCSAAVPLFYQNEMMYGPIKVEETDEYDEHPSDYDLDYENVTITTKDGVRLHCWLLRSNKGPRMASSTVIHFHGNVGNISDRLWQTKQLVDAGAGIIEILLVGYRGYGSKKLR